MKTIIIRITNEWIFVAEEYAVKISDTNIPYTHLQFNETSEIYWKAKMLSFSKESSLLKLEVVDFHPDDHSAFEDQNPKGIIRSLNFQPFFWNHFQGYLSTYQKKFLKDIITYERPKKKVIKRYEINERIPLNKIDFHHGYVTFYKHYKWEHGDGLRQIDLPGIIPEFEYIKDYFNKIIGKKTVDVTFEVAATQDEIYVERARSSDLELIDGDSVNVLKIGKMDHWSSRKPKFKPPDQDLFTLEEALECYGDQDFGNLDIFEKDLLFNLIEKEKVRNKNQLRFLGGNIQSSETPLLLTLVPQFGFLFSFEGREMNHYIWELLNSHATYVWSIPKTMEAVPILEHEIRTISAHGRAEYRAHFENTESLYFNLLLHKTKNYSYDEYFERWKLSLQNLLI